MGEGFRVPQGPFEGLAFVTDETGRVVGWGAAAARSTGIEAARALGRPCWSVLAGRDAEGTAVCGPGCPARRTVLGGRRSAALDFAMRADGGARVRLLHEHVIGIEAPSGRARALAHFLHEETVGAEARLADRLREAVARDAARQLDPTERSLLAWLASGETADAIAARLGTDRAGVRTVLQRVASALEADDRVTLIALAFRLGLAGAEGGARRKQSCASP